MPLMIYRILLKAPGFLFHNRQKGEIYMKFKIITLIAGIYLLASCSGSDQGIKLSDSAENTAYVEYLFCKNGPAMSQENFTGMIDYWNDIQDGMQNPVPMSVALQPRTATDLYDGMWVLVWESKEQSTKGWEEWLAGPAEDFIEKTSSILSCVDSNGDAVNYSFNVSSFRAAQAQDTEPGGVVGFNFCSYTDSFGPNELLEGNAVFNQWLDAAVEAAGTASPYFYTIHEPNFETPIPGSTAGSYDYAFHQFWDSEESRLQGLAMFEQTAPAPEGPQPDCIQEPFLFESLPLRSPQI